MTIANLNLELKEEDVIKFVHDNINNEIDKKEIKNNRAKRKIIVSTPVCSQPVSLTRHIQRSIFLIAKKNSLADPCTSDLSET